MGSIKHKEERMRGWFLPMFVRLSEARRRVVAQGLVEYALLILFVVIVIVAILAAVSRTMCTTWYIRLANSTAWGTGNVDSPCQ